MIKTSLNQALRNISNHSDASLIKQAWTDKPIEFKNSLLLIYTHLQTTAFSMMSMKELYRRF